MISTILSIFLFIIFTILGGFHFYWFFGGTWGLTQAIPTKNNENSSLSIPKIATLIVAFVLTLFGLMYLVKSSLVTVQLPIWMTDYGYWFIPILFIVRVVGDFNYVGVFKKIKNTKFAIADSKIFIPLCLAIGICGITIQLLTK